MTVKVQEDETQQLDLPATHVDYIEGCGLFSLAEYGYGSDDNPVTSIDGIRCPEEEEGEDHPIELMHVTATPVASPDAVKRDNVLAGDPWDGLSNFDANHYHHGREQFEYNLEEA
jgi:hypothetical protein